MHLPDMPKRMVPFPLILVAVTGTFVLVALYADVRGRERRVAETVPVNTPDVGVDNYQPLPDESASSTPVEGGETTPLQQVPEPLGLPPETPTSDIPAVAVFDCWRYEWRGERMIVDRDYRHISGYSIVPMVGEHTAHLRCEEQIYKQDVLRSDDGNTTVYWSADLNSDVQAPPMVEANTLYLVDKMTGELKTIARIPAEDDAFALMFSPDADSLFLRKIRWDNGGAYGQKIFKVTLATGNVRTYSYKEVWSPLLLTPDTNRAVGLEYSGGHPVAGGPAYLHRINLINGDRVRTRELSGVDQRGDTMAAPVFLDNERIILLGDGGEKILTSESAVVVNIFTGATARIPRITGRVVLLALTIDGSTLYTYSDGEAMPLTAIPVSALPKP